MVRIRRAACQGLKLRLLRLGWPLVISGWIEAVTIAAESSNGRQGEIGNVLILGGVAELSTERRHRDIECFGRAVPVLVPHLAHELISADSRARVGGEHREQIELLRS